MMLNTGVCIYKFDSYHTNIKMLYDFSLEVDLAVAEEVVVVVVVVCRAVVVEIRAGTQKILKQNSTESCSLEDSAMRQMIPHLDLTLNSGEQSQIVWS